MTRALYIGRFQPFHLGHLSVVKKTIQECDQLIIGIGSAEDNYQPENPFTAGERFEMIDRVLRAEGIAAEKYAIVPVRNINNYELWCDHVEQLVPYFDAIYTGSSIVKKLFEDQAKHPVKDVAFEHDISATEVRRRIKEGEDWQSMVHPKVAEFVEVIGGVERVRDV